MPLAKRFVTPRNPPGLFGTDSHTHREDNLPKCASARCACVLVCDSHDVITRSQHCAYVVCVCVPQCVTLVKIWDARAEHVIKLRKDVAWGGRVAQGQTNRRNSEPGMAIQ